MTICYSEFAIFLKSEYPERFIQSRFIPDSFQRIRTTEEPLNRFPASPSYNKTIVNTKQQVLCIITRIFNALCLLSPSTFILKIRWIDMWETNINWDDMLPWNIQETWNKFYMEVSAFKYMHIPQFINIYAAVV